MFRLVYVVILAFFWFGLPNVIYLYSLYVWIIIQGPILQNNTQTHLHKTLGDDNVLVVKFAEDKNGRNLKTNAQDAVALYGKFGKEGIRVGLRLYRFFGNHVSCLFCFVPPPLLLGICMIFKPLYFLLIQLRCDVQHMIWASSL